MLREEIKEEVKRILSEDRYIHSVNTAEECKELAKKYGVDSEKAYLVGLVHDIAKGMTDEELYDYAKNNGIKISEAEEVRKGLLHPKVGADIAKKKYKFSKDMVDAISYHTLTNKDMDMLAKILYVSDKTEKARSYQDVDVVRGILSENIDKAILYILEYEITKCIKRGRVIPKESIDTRNMLLLSLGDSINKEE